MDDRIDVWCITLSDQPEIIGAAHALLCADERTRAARFRVSVVRDRFVQSRALLRLLVAARCKASTADVRFSHGPHGKPFLSAPSATLRFSASHSDQIAAFAFANDVEVGIDVEHEHPMPHTLAIAQRFFGPQELSSLQELNPPERDVAFFKYWVRKEAFIKALGGGLSIPLNSFQVSLDTEQVTALDSTGSAGRASAWLIHGFSAAPRCPGAVAFPAARRSIHIRRAMAVDLLRDR